MTTSLLQTFVNASSAQPTSIHVSPNYPRYDADFSGKSSTVQTAVLDAVVHNRFEKQAESNSERLQPDVADETSFAAEQNRFISQAKTYGKRKNSSSNIFNKHGFTEPRVAASRRRKQRYQNGRAYSQYGRGQYGQVEKMQGVEMGVNNLPQAIIILIIGVLIIIANIVVLAALITMPGKC